MNNKQQTTLLIIPDTSLGLDYLLLPETHKRYPGLITAALARRLKCQQDWQSLGSTLTYICQIANASLQVDVLREVSDLLVSMPIASLRATGQYYQGQVLLRIGELDAARFLFEKLVDDPQFRQRVRAIASIATCYWISRDFDAATSYYYEALRGARSGHVDFVTLFKSQWMLAVTRSIQGDHNTALTSLENLNPLVHFIAKFQPAIYYDYLNSLAVRHMALGHFSKAERLCEIFLSSPFARNFPNWSETRNELREAREAVAATVFVNVEQLPQQHPKIEKRPIQTPEFDAAPTVKRPIDPLAEIESILESQLFFDRAVIEIIQSHTEARINPAQAISVLLKPHSDISLVAYLRFPITSTSKQNLSTVQPEGVVASQARPLLSLTDVVPDNSRPRAPPTSITSREY